MADLVSACEAEVEQLRSRRGQHDVARLEIAMDDVRAVRMGECARDLHAEPEDVGRRQHAARQPIVQRLTLEILHDDERLAVVVANVVQRADVGMAQ